MITIKIFTLLIISIIFECLGDYFVKLWSINEKSIYPFLWSLIAYNIMLFTWMCTVWNSKEISIVGTIWLLLGQIVLLFVGVGIFNEPVTIKQ